MKTSGITIALVTAAMALSGCGYRIGAHSDVGTVASVTATAAASMHTDSAAPPPAADTASIPANQSLPPNAQGDPACASPLAWGRQPQGRGVLVSVWAQRPTAVTVLVQTHTGADVAERAVIERKDLRLFEFPDVDFDAVREVLIMTSTARCFAVADPVTFR